MISTRLRLPRRPDAAKSAREAVDTLGERLEESVLRDLRLLVTELVGSRMARPARSAASWIELDLNVRDGLVRVELRDFGQRWAFEPSPATFEPESSSGWGLYLVDRLADRWALERAEASVRIWFEFDL